MKNISENNPLEVSRAFLADLAVHNDRDWLNENKDRQKSAQDEFKEFVSALYQGLMLFDPSIAGQDPHKSIFRIYRDVRFSKDKRPYKTNFGVFLKKGGKKSPYAGYYFHLEPGKSFLAGGIYMPPTEILQKVRQEIDYNGSEVDQLMSDPDFVSNFVEMKGDCLKRPPRGFSEEHPHIDLIKHKSFLMVANLSDEEISWQDFRERTLSIYKAMLPWNTFLNRAMD